MRQTGMNRKGVVRLSDVAKFAEVGLTTASVVLNGSRSATRISDATRERIHNAATSLGYHRSAIATALSVGRTDILGFYSGYHYMDARNPFYTEIFGGLQDGCNDHAKDLLTHGTFRDQSPDTVFRGLVNGKIDGLILHLDPTDPIVEMLAASHLPAIAIADAVPALPSVIVDDVHGARLLAQHLAEKGHRRILYRTKTAGRISLSRRQEAFRLEAAKLGMCIVETEYEWPNPVTDEEKAILARPKNERPTAAVCWNDNAAYCLLDECPALGIRVPEDLAVVGFDGFVPFPRYAMTLTTVSAPWALVARTAVSLLVAKIAGETVPEETVLPVKLMRGDTT